MSERPGAGGYRAGVAGFRDRGSETDAARRAPTCVLVIFGASGDAYERVILDALIGDATLFIRADEVARSWRIVDPLLAYWHHAPDPTPLYHAGTWGPRKPHSSSRRTVAGGTIRDAVAL